MEFNTNISNSLISFNKEEVKSKSFRTLKKGGPPSNLRILNEIDSVQYRERKGEIET